MTPPSARRCRMAKESWGVERSASNRKASHPNSTAVRAQDSAKPREKCRVSWEKTRRGRRVSPWRRDRADGGDHAAHGARDVEIVHGVGAHARVLGAAVRPARALFRQGHDLAHRAPAQAAGSEGQCPEKPVVQFGPVAALDQFRHGGVIDRVGGGAEKGQDVVPGLFKDLARRHGGFESCWQVAHRMVGGSSIRHPLKRRTTFRESEKHRIFPTTRHPNPLARGREIGSGGRGRAEPRRSHPYRSHHEDPCHRRCRIHWQSRCGTLPGAGRDRRARQPAFGLPTQPRRTQRHVPRRLDHRPRGRAGGRAWRGPRLPPRGHGFGAGKHVKPQECVKINVQGLLTVLEEASPAGARKLVLASSAAVYGDNPAVPKVEDMLPEPKSPYAITELNGEHYLEMFRRREHRDRLAALLQCLRSTPGSQERLCGGRSHLHAPCLCRPADRHLRRWQADA